MTSFNPPSTTADPPRPPTADEEGLSDRQYQLVASMATVSSSAAGPVLGSAAFPADPGHGCCDGHGRGCFFPCDGNCC